MRVLRARAGTLPPPLQNVICIYLSVNKIFVCGCMLLLCCRPFRESQAPGYSRVPEINLHPLVTHPYIALPPCSPQEEKEILLRVQNHMVDSEDYVRCRDIATDWKVIFEVCRLPIHTTVW